MTEDTYIKTLRLASLLMAMLLLGSCAADSDEPTTGQRMPVSFTTGFLTTVTRSTLDNEWTSGTSITVCRLKQTGETADVTFDYTTAAAGQSVTLSRSADDKFYWPASDPTWLFDAWPASYGSRPEGKTLSVAANQSAVDLSTYDILYAPTVTATYRQTVPLVFYHQPARVKVIVSTSATEGQKAATAVAYGGGALGLTGEITTLNTSAQNGTTTWNITSTKNQTITMKQTSADDTNHAYAFECVLPPQSGGSSSTELIKITTDGGTTYTYKNTFNLQSGYLYTYNLVASKRGVLTLSSLQITDWDAATGVEDVRTITK